MPQKNVSEMYKHTLADELCVRMPCRQSARGHSGKTTSGEGKRTNPKSYKCMWIERNLKALKNYR